MPRRLRFCDPSCENELGTLEVPYSPAGSSGAALGFWRLASGPADAHGAQSAKFVLEDQHAFLIFDGLYDGERIAGAVHAIHKDGEGSRLSSVALLETPHTAGGEVGDFLCTRLFSFWGTPKPKAAQGG